LPEIRFAFYFPAIGMKTDEVNVDFSPAGSCIRSAGAASGWKVNIVKVKCVSHAIFFSPSLHRLLGILPIKGYKIVLTIVLFPVPAGGVQSQ